MLLGFRQQTGTFSEQYTKNKHVLWRVGQRQAGGSRDRWKRMETLSCAERSVREYWKYALFCCMINEEKGRRRCNTAEAALHLPGKYGMIQKS